MRRRQQVLIIDDDPMIHQLVRARLAELSVEIFSAHTGQEGLDAAREHRPDLILLDVSLPDLDGFAVCKTLKQSPRTREFPVIFLTGNDHTKHKLNGFALGAVDYVTKPFDSIELLARTRAVLRTQALVEALERQAVTDSLTGLPNRAAFCKSLSQAVDGLEAKQSEHIAVIFIDLDGFKRINDSLGHKIGDQLLIYVANELQHFVDDYKREHGPHSATVARLGGDEFTILLEQVGSEAQVLEQMEAMREKLCVPRKLDGFEITVKASVGIRICNATDPRINLDDLMRDSDAAMYQAKGKGKNQCVVFTAQMHRDAIGRLEMEADLAGALAGNQFRLYYQPICDLESGEIKGFEALLRWHHPEHGVLGPDQFIHILEDTGQIIEVGTWVMDTACEQLAKWHQRFPQYAPMVMSINLSRVQLHIPDLVEQILSVASKHAVAPQQIQLEITESVIMHESKHVVPTMERLRKEGIRLAMDDFGTGYSSLALLHQFPLDVLKIDRAFINRMTESRSYTAVVNAIISLAENLNLRVVAEGVETVGQMVQLQTLDCLLGQGYFFSKPMTAQDGQDWLIQQSQTIQGKSAKTRKPKVA